MTPFDLLQRATNHCNPPATITKLPHGNCYLVAQSQSVKFQIYKPHDSPQWRVSNYTGDNAPRKTIAYSAEHLYTMFACCSVLNDYERGVYTND